MAQYVDNKVLKGSDDPMVLLLIEEGDEVAQCDQYGNQEYVEIADHDYYIVNYGAGIRGDGVVTLSPYSQYTFASLQEAKEFLADY